MKLEDCKEGQLVLATKKSCMTVYSMKDFLEVYPLGVAYIKYVVGDYVALESKSGIGDFTFSPKDLILLGDN